MPAEAIELGPIGSAVASNIRRARTVKRLSQQALGDGMAELGRSRHGSAIARMESGDRRIDVDDLVTIALVLNSKVIDLLLPEPDDDGEVRLTPIVSLPNVEARDLFVSGLPGLNSLPQEYGTSAERIAWLAGTQFAMSRQEAQDAEGRTVAEAQRAVPPLLSEQATSLMALGDRVAAVVRRGGAALDGPDHALHLAAIETAMAALQSEIAIIRTETSNGND